MANNSGSRAGMAKVVAVTVLTVAAGLLGPATAGAAPASTSVAESQHSADAGLRSRCAVWQRTTANYQGLTAGYSWAWNVVVDIYDTGDRVREIQCLLDWWGEYGGPLNGDYDVNTWWGVREVQERCGIDVDGTVGPQTWRCIRRGGEV